MSCRRVAEASFPTAMISDCVTPVSPPDCTIAITTRRVYIQVHILDRNSVSVSGVAAAPGSDTKVRPSNLTARGPLLEQSQGACRTGRSRRPGRGRAELEPKSASPRGGRLRLLYPGLEPTPGDPHAMHDHCELARHSGEQASHRSPKPTAPRAGVRTSLGHSDRGAFRRVDAEEVGLPDSETAELEQLTAERANCSTPRTRRRRREKSRPSPPASIHRSAITSRG